MPGAVDSRRHPPFLLCSTPHSEYYLPPLLIVRVVVWEVVVLFVYLSAFVGPVLVGSAQIIGCSFCSELFGVYWYWLHSDHPAPLKSLNSDTTHSRNSRGHTLP